MRYPRKLKKRCKLKVRRLREEKKRRIYDLQTYNKLETIAALSGNLNPWESIARIIGMAARLVEDTRAIAAQPIPKWQTLAAKHQYVMPYSPGSGEIVISKKGHAVLTAEETKNHFPESMLQYYPTGKEMIERGLLSPVKPFTVPLDIKRFKRNSKWTKSQRR